MSLISKILRDVEGNRQVSHAVCSKKIQRLALAAKISPPQSAVSSGLVHQTSKSNHTSGGTL